MAVWEGASFTVTGFNFPHLLLIKTALLMGLDGSFSFFLSAAAASRKQFYPLYFLFFFLGQTCRPVSDAEWQKELERRPQIAILAGKISAFDQKSSGVVKRRETRLRWFKAAACDRPAAYRPYYRRAILSRKTAQSCLKLPLRWASSCRHLEVKVLFFLFMKAGATCAAWTSQFSLPLVLPAFPRSVTRLKLFQPHEGGWSTNSLCLPPPPPGLWKMKGAFMGVSWVDRSLSKSLSIDLWTHLKENSDVT